MVHRRGDDATDDDEVSQVDGNLWSDDSDLDGDQPSVSTPDHPPDQELLDTKEVELRLSSDPVNHQTPERHTLQVLQEPSTTQHVANGQLSPDRQLSPNGQPSPNGEQLSRHGHLSPNGNLSTLHTVVTDSGEAPQPCGATVFAPISSRKKTEPVPFQ
ncbi:hypothetical protein T484DRAFT_3541283 [Baffinella frigidus]|nr:hypothetical protein T484DRAFT_3541283 [Cryptophyta sp. CCMP2293]